MAVREIPLVCIRSRDMLLRLKKSGPYSIKVVKKVTKKDIEGAIFADEESIKELQSRVNVQNVMLLENIEKKYLEIKDSKEWKEICEAHKKLEEYNRLCRSWSSENCNEEAYDEMMKILKDSFVSRYMEIISKNSYCEFYAQREELIYSKDAHYVSLINEIKEDISLLKEFCLVHPNVIKGNKISR